MKNWITLLTILFATSLVASEGLLSPEEQIEAAAAVGPVIEITGNGYVIENGDAWTSRYDLTDFGYERVGDRTGDHYFLIKNNGDQDLVIDGPSYVSIVGLDNDHFVVRAYPSATITPGSSSPFAIAFEPESYGEKQATVMIYSNDPSNGTFSFMISGGDDDDDDHGCSLGRASLRGMLPTALLITVMIIIRQLIYRRRHSC